MKPFEFTLLWYSLIAGSLFAAQIAAAPFPLDEILDFHRSDVPCRRLSVLIRDRGIDFLPTQDALGTLRSAGVCAAAIEEISQRGKQVAPQRPVGQITELIRSAIGHSDDGRYAAAVGLLEKANALAGENSELLGLIKKVHTASALEKTFSGNERFRLEDLERLIGALTPKRIVTLIAERGIFCVLPQQYTTKLSGAGVDDRVIIAIDKKGFENERARGKLLATAKTFFEEAQYAQAIETLETAKNICPSDKQILASLETFRKAQTAEGTLRPGVLGHNELTSLIESNVAGKRIARLIGQRDIGFSTFTQEDEKLFRAAGADDQVIVALKAKLISKNPAAIPVPSEAIRLVNLGAEMIRQKRFQEALEHSVRALALSKSYDKAWELEGDALRGFQRFSEAIGSYNKALEIDPAEPFIWTKKGLALHDLSKHQEAVQSFDKALDINPANQAAWIFRGDSLLAMKRCQEARGSYDKALEVNSKLQLTLMPRYELIKQCGP